MLINGKEFVIAPETNLREANLHNADLQNVNLQGALLQRANLAGANLHGANLRWANLQNVNLQGANLCDTNLVHADLQDANLRDTVLLLADLRGVNLLFANLQGAILPTDETFEDYCKNVKCLFGDKLPEAIAAWGCHDWDNCPLFAAYGVDSINQLPWLIRPHAELFITLFDAKILPCPTID